MYNRDKLNQLSNSLDLATQGCGDEVTEYWDNICLLFTSYVHCSEGLQKALNDELDLILQDIEENYHIVEETAPPQPARTYKTLQYKGE